MKLSTRVGTLALVGGLGTLMLGALALAVRMEPDTGHGEDIGRGFALAFLLPIMALTACLGLGAGVGGIVGAKRWGRRASCGALVLVFIGTMCAAIAMVGLPWAP